MNNTEISRRLALAIGYVPQDVLIQHDYVLVNRNGEWHWFNHLEERTIFRIAARYRMFPQWLATCKTWMVKREWFFTFKMTEHLQVTHDCPATCIALAVIEASERGLLL